jgi:hypothetical protein
VAGARMRASPMAPGDFITKMTSNAPLVILVYSVFTTALISVQIPINSPLTIMFQRAE